MVLLDTETPGTSGEIYSDDAEGKARTRDPLITNLMLKPLSYTAQKAIAGTELSLSSWCIASLYIYHLRSHCKFLYWYQEFLCSVEPLYFSDEKSVTVEK